MNTGSCHCGKVTFKVPQQLGDVRYCYCETCRKLSGSAFSAVALIASDGFELLSGQDDLAVYESSPDKFRYYCGHCHCQIHAAVASQPDYVRLRLGVLDFEPDVQIVAHMWVSEKPHWHVIHDDLPQFAKWGSA